MEVILCQDFIKLGHVGEIVKVKDGYARNFLIPKKVACLATVANKRRIELERARQAAKYVEEKKAAVQLAQKLAKSSCTVTVEVNDLEKLYGSVTEMDVVKALEVEGFNIDKKDIIMEQAIEELGIFEVGINLHSEVTTKIRLWVAKK
ncbi:MAG: 50S ribosomal protein L9 [Candidatus Omnitrophica bacterium]|nr:50S ribosomal protein L9 [Candidatus Omnitrophota bacterium]